VPPSKNSKSAKVSQSGFSIAERDQAEVVLVFRTGQRLIQGVSGLVFMPPISDLNRVSCPSSEILGQLAA
jgi:hypothetical protein